MMINASSMVVAQSVRLKDRVRDHELTRDVLIPSNCALSREVTFRRVKGGISNTISHPMMSYGVRLECQGRKRATAIPTAL